MFKIQEFHCMNKAAEHIKKALAEIESTKSLDFQIIHSICDSECQEDSGSWEKISEILLSYLRDLDSQQGYIIHLDDHWDYIDCEEPDENYDIHNPQDINGVYVNAGEGVVIFNNMFAICEGQYPVIVTKKTLFDKNKREIMELLGSTKIDEDYTAKISPALYVEIK